MAPMDEDVAPVAVEIERFVAGGVGLGHDLTGRVVLVEGALPGDDVEVEVISAKERLINGRIGRMLRAGPARIDPVCPEVALGCGGCDLQHVDAVQQVLLKVDIVVDALRHTAGISGVDVRPGPELPAFGYRTMLRCGVDPDTGRLGFRSRRSHNIHVVDDCLIAHPLAAGIIRESLFPVAHEVTIRVGAVTGERMVVVKGDVGGEVVPDGVLVCGRFPRSPGRASGDPSRRGQAAVTERGIAGTARGTAGERPAATTVHIHEVVAGRRFRISANSFFQGRPDGAEVLVGAAARALVDFDPVSDRLVDLYGGVGLFTGVLGARRAVLVEQSKAAVTDARVNLADLGTSVVHSSVERWRPVAADAVVADPPRSGLGKSGVGAVLATGAPSVALISCDPASMARDTRLLVDGGYELLDVEVIDMFPQTHHVETVSAFRRIRG